MQLLGPVSPGVVTRYQDILRKNQGSGGGSILDDLSSRKILVSRYNQASPNVIAASQSTHDTAKTSIYMPSPPVSKLRGKRERKLATRTIDILDTLSPYPFNLIFHLPDLEDADLLRGLVKGSYIDECCS